MVAGEGVELPTRGFLAFGVATIAWAVEVPNYGRMIKTSQNIGVLGKDLASDSTNFHMGATVSRRPILRFLETTRCLFR